MEKQVERDFDGEAVAIRQRNTFFYIYQQIKRNKIYYD